jgi:uncharacterized membrane protein YdjX (TVP38/TMEM64 family)
MALFPMTLFSAVAGLLFGPVAGSVLVWSGAVLGASGAFGLGRVISGTALREVAGHGLNRLDAYLAARGTVAVMLVRLVPLFPFGLVNYGTAVTSIGFRHYLIGTAVGIIPASVMYVVLGASITDPQSPAFAVSAGGLLVLTVGGTLAARRAWLRSHSGEDAR